MTAPEPSSPPGGAQNPGNRRTWTLLVMALVFLLPSLYGFGGKFYELVKLTNGDPDGLFAISPIVSYLLATLGFFCLFGWALGHGMFSDIERPKRLLLEREALLDASCPEIAGPGLSRRTAAVPVGTQPSLTHQDSE